MIRYEVTCTNTYSVWAANEEDAIIIGESLDNGGDYPEELGHGKCVETTTEAEQVGTE